MRHYPKGCHVTAIQNGARTCTRPDKITTPQTIDILFYKVSGVQRTQFGDCLIVRPRGKKKWWVFRLEICHTGFTQWRFVLNTPDYNVAVMAAVLGPQHED